MASLGELLAEDGFKKEKLKFRSKVSATSRAVSMPLYPGYRVNPLFSPSDSRISSGRTGSDLFSRGSQSSLTEHGGMGVGLIDGYEHDPPEMEGFIGSGCNDFQEIEGFNGRFNAPHLDSVEELEIYRGPLSYESRESEASMDRYSDYVLENQGYKEMYRNEFFEDERFRNRNSKSFEVKTSFSDDLRSRRHDDIGSSGSEASLDDAAIQAMTSILSGYIKHFLKDESFQISIRHSCLPSLNFSSARESICKDSGVVANLKEAIRTIERVVREALDPNELRKASLQLTAITGLNSEDLKDEFTSGICNSHLAACAHLYLSVICIIQKEDRVSAKHLLQVFCDSPFQARTILLPGLWDNLFLPHLSHLRVWYDKEAESIPRTTSWTKKMKLLDKVYKDILDMGTYQFALYYKEWLEGTEAPAFPSIPVPSASFQGESSRIASSYGVSSLGTSVSSQPVVGKQLYESVFSQSKNMETADGVQGRDEREDVEEQSTVCMRTSEGLIEEDEETRTYSSRPGIHTGEYIQEEHITSFPNLNASSHVQLSNINYTQSVLKKAGMVSMAFDYESMGASSSAEPSGISEDFDQGSFLSSIPKDFMCPLTGQLFRDPVTLETGQTFERVAIKEWFDRGNRTCPVTGRALEHLSVPNTNFLLKRVVDGWKSEHRRDLLVFSMQIAGNMIKQDCKSKDELALLIIEQLLTDFSTEEQLENAKHFISLGGLNFLMLRLEFGNLEEKTRVVSLLICCIKADGNCRSYLALKIKKPCILELLHSKHVSASTHAVLLLVELIFLNSRMAITLFLTGLVTEAIVNTMHVLLVYLQSSPPEERATVAVLLLHFDLMVEPRRCSIYRDEAVDALTMALECSFSDEKVKPNSRKALLMLGGHFSFSGDVLTETWLLKQAGFYDGSGIIFADYDDEDNETTSGVEAKEREEWLKNVAMVLLGNGNKSFLQTVSRCLGSGNSDLVKVCLTTVAWFSRALASLPIAGLQISEFSALIFWLKERLVIGVKAEDRVLASMSLLNFSNIPECRVLIMTFAEEMRNPLSSLVKVTWTAKHLYDAIFGEFQESKGKKSTRS